MSRRKTYIDLSFKVWTEFLFVAECLALGELLFVGDSKLVG